VRRGRRERARVGELTRASRSSISVATRFCPSSAWRQHRHSLELEAGMLPSPSRPLRVSADYARPRNGRIRPEYSACDQPLRLVSHFSLLFTKNQRNSSAPAVRKRSALCLFTFLRTILFFILHACFNRFNVSITLYHPYVRSLHSSAHNCAAWNACWGDAIE
jgi:hypothetical protein